MMSAVDAVNAVTGAVESAPETARRSQTLRRSGKDARQTAATRHLNREMAWLEFNARVLYEAQDARNALLDRVRFLSIFASNLDEFFQVRVSGLRQQVRAGMTTQPDGGGPAAQLEAVRARVLELIGVHSATYRGIRRDLNRAGVQLLEYVDVPNDHEALRARFRSEIHPVLTPLAVDPGHHFPYISTLSLSIAVGLRNPETGARGFARVKVPPSLPRLLELDPTPDQQPGQHRFVLLDQVIEANLDLLFTGMDIEEHHLFRVTRNADLVLEDEADDLLLAIEEELQRRRFGEAVRLEVERTMPEGMRSLLLHGIGVTEDQVYAVSGMLDLTGLAVIADLSRPDLRAEAWTPVTPRRLQSGIDGDGPDIFAEIRAGDILLHHPYESFTNTVERFVEQAAEDPDVLAIKLTLYRTSGESPIVEHLIQAAERGKQIVALVEIKARFDERANIAWARKLERAGAHVVYGLVGLKTHCKTLLVIRREGGSLRRYVHVGTGNYNSRTARTYTDLGILTARPDIGQDVTDLFNMLTGMARQQGFRRLLVAPQALRERFLALVEREISHAEQGRAARIALKMNALVDQECIEALYRASGAGVEIDLIIRGASTLIPGRPAMSERIRVRSIIGEFLEHSRIWRFENAGQREWYIGSGDLMDRNLDRRVEAFVPVLAQDAQREIDFILETMLADDRRAWLMRADGAWERVDHGREPTSVDTHATLRRHALAAVAPRSTDWAGSGSREPWS